MHTTIEGGLIARPSMWEGQMRTSRTLSPACNALHWTWELALSVAPRVPSTSVPWAEIAV